MFIVDIATSVLREDFIVLSPRERGFPESYHMEDNSNTENITDGTVLGFQIFEVDYFWSYVAWSSASHEHVLLVAILSQSEISNNTVVVSIFPEEDVLGFQISVHDVLHMHDLQSFEDAPHDSFGLGYAEFMFGFYFVVELTSFQQFHSNVD